MPVFRVNPGRFTRPPLLLLALSCALSSLAGSKAPDSSVSVAANSTLQFVHRIILRPSRPPATALSPLKKRLQSAGWQLNVLRTMSGGAWVADLTGRLPASKLEKQMHQWQHHGWVDYATFDEWVAPAAIPNDSLFDLQWQLGTSTDHLAAMNVTDAWDVTQGSSDVVVAIIDTGVRFEHEDLTGRLLPGYDFVSGINQFRLRNRVPDSLNYVKAHDGDGRDADATDPGDGVDAETRELMENQDLECPLQESSWHGTAIASLIAANANDSIGMTGVDWAAKILPVRAIGRCGGRRSDLLDAIRWAAGVEDSALPENPTPARIINLSLGIDDVCTASDQHAINDAVANGSIIVAAVGNLGRNLNTQPSSPSHCDNVLGVTAVDSFGFRANYSSFGNDADIAAPGGEGASGDNLPILIATNDGYLSPSSGSSHRLTTGTSVAAPLVSGVMSLMLSVNSALSNAELTALVKNSARNFPNDNDLQRLPGGHQTTNLPCTIDTCGSGLIDAAAAVNAALNFDPSDPGILAKAILEDQPVFRSTGGAAAAPVMTACLFFVVFLRRRAISAKNQNGVRRILR